MAKRSTAACYDLWAHTYDQRWQHYMDATHAVLLACLDLPQHGHLLDIGCGTGTLLARIAATAPTTRLTGIDASRGMLRVARRKLKGRANVTVVHGQASALPLADQSQEVVTTASMLHYLYRPSQACAEAHRVLKPVGQIAIVDYLPRPIAGSGIDGLIRRYDPGHVRCRNRRELAAILEWAGFTAIQVDDFPIDTMFRGLVGMARRP